MNKRTRKFGIEILQRAEEASLLDKQHNNTLWRDVAKKEMRNVSITFKILDSGENPSVGFSGLSVQMVFDIKLDLTRKARHFVDGHVNPNPVDSTYTEVVSSITLRIAITYAVLLGVDIFNHKGYQSCLVDQDL